MNFRFEPSNLAHIYKARTEEATCQKTVAKWNPISPHS